MINSQINKINFFHSLVFFIFTSIFSIIFDQFQNLYISPMICLFLILSIGISHGALDNQKGKRLLNFYKIKNNSIFYLLYLLIAIIIIIFWLSIPTLSLVVFLIVAAYHFGKEDTDFLIQKKLNKDIIFYFFKGLLLIIAPLMFHFTETVNIFKLLLVENENFYLILSFIETNNLIFYIFLITLIVHIYLFSRDFKILNILIFFDFISILILNYFFSPLVAFTVYFCFLHSFRHSISLINEIDNIDFKSGSLKFMKIAMPLTILTAIFYIISLYFLTNYYPINDAIFKTIFIGLASLTFPHILLEYLLEKNEK